VPCDYYHTDIITTNLPLHAEKIRGFFFGYVGAFDEVKDAHQYEAMHFHWNRMIPYGYPSEHYHPKLSWDERKIFCGFAGSFSQNNHFTNHLKSHIYQYRFQFLKAAQEYLKDAFDLRDFGDYFAYIDHLQSCQTAINIPGIMGCINQRQYEIQAAGTLLIQWWYPELQQLGFINYENCLTFHNEKELCECFEWVKAHPTEADQIRLNGLKFAQNQTWTRRTEEMIARISTVTEREQQRITAIEYQRLKELFPLMEEQYPVPMIKVTKQNVPTH
jgi:hypothetical protein